MIKNIVSTIVNVTSGLTTKLENINTNINNNILTEENYTNLSSKILQLFSLFESSNNTPEYDNLNKFLGPNIILDVVDNKIIVKDNYNYNFILGENLPNIEGYSEGPTVFFTASTKEEYILYLEAIKDLSMVLRDLLESSGQIKRPIEYIIKFRYYTEENFAYFYDYEIIGLYLVISKNNNKWIIKPLGDLIIISKFKAPIPTPIP